jgi:single-stranded-DNA-specific exonuclease
MTAALALNDIADAAGIALPAIGDTASGIPWRLRRFDPRAALAIAQRAGVDLPVARLLAARRVAAEGAARHLKPTLRDSLPDPFVLTDMERAALRIADAATNGETVGVFGDYDVDGTTAAAILKLYCDEIGVPVAVYLPDRVSEGYGPSIGAFRELAKAGARCIVTVDCGAAARQVIEQASGEGLDVVVFDHHLTAAAAPNALAVVNPNRPDDRSGLGGLCAAAIAFMGLVAINRELRARGFFRTRTEPDLRRLLDLVALGLVCDIMPMTGLARVLTAQGLKVLDARPNPGLAALRARAGARGAASVFQLGFVLGPRINAAGRIGHARLALELLTTGDEARRAALADRLHVMNAERQAIETSVLEDALQIAASGDGRTVVIAGEGWHQGVIGIVAGRLKERLGRPAVVIALDGETGKGSARSIEGVDLGGAVNAAKAEGLLLAGGGHAMAAGLTIARSRIEDFARFLEGRLAGAVERSLADRRLDIDAVVGASAVSRRFAAMIAAAGPFGPRNPEPIFVLTNMRARALKAAGKGHIVCALVSETGESVRAIAFRAGEGQLAAALAGERMIHLAGRIRADDWRGGEAAQFEIADVAPAA